MRKRWGVGMPGDGEEEATADGDGVAEGTAEWQAISRVCNPVHHAMTPRKPGGLESARCHPLQLPGAPKIPFHILKVDENILCHCPPIVRRSPHGRENSI